MRIGVVFPQRELGGDAGAVSAYASFVNSASIPGPPRAWTRRLLRCGVAAGPVFVAVFLAEGAVRDGYRPLRHPVSSLALGPRGWIQAGNFAAAGTLFLAGAAGLARAGDPAAGRAAPALIGAAGAGLIGAAVFTTDPVSGYPPGTPDALTRPTRAGIAHNLAAVPVFAGLPAAAVASGWRCWRAGRHRFGLYSAGTAVTMLPAMALAGAGFGQSPRLNGLGGLFQRASIITGFAWLTTVSAQALRRTPATAAPRHQARTPPGRAGSCPTRRRRFSVPVVAAGVATTHFGLHQTAAVYSAALAVLAAAAAGIFLFRRPSRPRGPAQRHEQGRTADPQGRGR